MAEGRPAGFGLTSGQTHASQPAADRLDGLDDKTVVPADKAHDSDAIRKQVEGKGGRADIPPKSNRNETFAFGIRLYRQCNRVGRFFSKLKQFRRLETRYGKNPETFLAAVKPASVMIWIRASRGCRLVERDVFVIVRSGTPRAELPQRPHAEAAGCRQGDEARRHGAETEFGVDVHGAGVVGAWLAVGGGQQVLPTRPVVAVRIRRRRIAEPGQEMAHAVRVHGVVEIARRDHRKAVGNRCRVDPPAVGAQPKSVNGVGDEHIECPVAGWFETDESFGGDARLGMVDGLQRQFTA